MKDGEYELLSVHPDTEDWKAFHEISRTALFNQNASEYEPESHDAYFSRPATRNNLLLKWHGKPVAITTLDNFENGVAATRGVAVASELQNQGHGRLLGILTQKFAKHCGITMLCVNAGYSATGFYKRLGFNEEIWEPSEYESGEFHETMIQMVCRL